jgi:ABC-type bacteriocin/lantibiotic exporter with double-glycine peptidase domain
VSGESVARVRELENIRSFLTGHAITVVLDLFFSFVFVSVMFFYSPVLTLVVLSSLPVYVLLSVIFTPILRARLHEKFNRGAENQAFLVESISGIDTVKASAVEPQWTRKWDNQLAAYVSSSFKTATVSSVANGAITHGQQDGHPGHHVFWRQAGDGRQAHRRPVDRLQHAVRPGHRPHPAPGSAVDRLPANRDLGAATG